MTNNTKPAAITVKADNAVADGKGGYLAKGDKIEGASKETLESLKAKGLI